MAAEASFFFISSSNSVCFIFAIAGRASPNRTSSTAAMVATDSSLGAPFGDCTGLNSAASMRAHWLVASSSLPVAAASDFSFLPAIFLSSSAFFAAFAPSCAMSCAWQFSHGPHPHSPSRPLPH